MKGHKFESLEASSPFTTSLLRGRTSLAAAGSQHTSKANAGGYIVDGYLNFQNRENMQAWNLLKRFQGPVFEEKLLLQKAYNSQHLLIWEAPFEKWSVYLGIAQIAFACIFTAIP